MRGLSLVADSGCFSLVAVHGLLIAVASLVVVPGLSSAGSVVVGHRASLLHSTWDLLGPGIEPVSLALQDGFLANGPPGKPKI